MVVGYALFLRVDLDPVYAAVILPSMLLIGAACALVFPSLNIQATNGVPDHEQGMVSGCSTPPCRWAGRSSSPW